MELIEYGLSRLILTAYSLTKNQVKALAIGAVAVGCAGAMLIAGANSTSRYDAQEAAKENAVSVSGRNIGEAVPQSVPEYMVNILTEATQDEIAAAREAETAYHESALCVSGRHGGPGMQTYQPYTQEATEAITALAAAIYTGAGGCSDETMRMFGDVVLNRVEDNRFPDSIVEVITQPGQFGMDGGIIWPERSTEKEETETLNRCYQIALEIMRGYHSEVYGQRYIWAATEPQGHTQIWSEGICFGK